MAIRCPDCSREYDVTLFEFEKSIICDCGTTVTLSHLKITEETLLSQKREESKIAEIRRTADRIASLIVGTDYPMIDIEIEKQKLRKKISEFFPEKSGLYNLIYEPRFKRLKDQFRAAE